MIPRGARLDDRRLTGLCATCMRRKRCPKAYTYVNLSECKAHKVHSLKGRKSTTNN